MSRRIERINEVIREELGKMILKEIELPSGVVATITRVDASPDLTQAKVFISVIPDKMAEKVMAALRARIYDAQSVLNQKLQIRRVPKIILIPDQITRKAARIEELLEEIKEDRK